MQFYRLHKLLCDVFTNITNKSDIYYKINPGKKKKKVKLISHEIEEEVIILCLFFVVIFFSIFLYNIQWHKKNRGSLN